MTHLLAPILGTLLAIIGGIPLHAWWSKRREDREFADFLRNPTKERPRRNYRRNA